MKQSFNIELFKLIKNRSALILLLSYILINLLSISLSYYFVFNFTEKLTKSSLFEFPIIWNFISFITAFMKIFILLILANSISSEFTNLTMRQNLIDGMTKRQFITSKLLLIITLSAFATLINMICVFLFAKQFNGINIFLESYFLINYFLKFVGFLSFGMFITFIFKKSTIAIGFIFVWYLLESSIIMYFQKIKALSLEIYLPLKSMSNMIKNPFFRLEEVKELNKSITGNVEVFQYKTTTIEYIIIIIWILIFYSSCYYLLKKQNL